MVESLKQSSTYSKKSRKGGHFYSYFYFVKIFIVPKRFPPTSECSCVGINELFTQPKFFFLKHWRRISRRDAIICFRLVLLAGLLGGKNVLTTCWIHATAYRTGFRSLNHFRRPIFSSRISITSSGKPETKHMALFIKTKVCLHRYSLTCSFFSAPQLAPVVLKVRRPVERKNDLVLWKKFCDVYHGACYWAGKFTTINAKWPNN